MINLGLLSLNSLINAFMLLFMLLLHILERGVMPFLHYLLPSGPSPDMILSLFFT